MRRLLVLAVVLFPAFVLLGRPGYAQPLFMGLGDLPGGKFQSYAYGVSADGSVVVGESTGASGPEAFIWTSEGGMVGLGDLPGGDFYSSASGVSASGSTVVGRSLIAPPDWYSDKSEAFIWTSEGGMVGLGDLPGGYFSSYATGVSADGSTVVGMSRSSPGYEAFIWASEGGLVGLGDLPGGSFYSSASGVSASGSTVVGGASGTSGSEAFLWTSNSGMVGLGDLPGGSFNSSASAISADGSTVVGSSSSSSASTGWLEAFRWTSNSGMVGLGDLPGGVFHSEALVVSADGSVIMGESSSASSREAFVWDAANGMRELDVLLTGLGLDLAGWELRAPLDTSADGRVIVGYGINPSGDFEGWIAILPAACADHIDNDGDGLVDFSGADPGCIDSEDIDERDPLLPCDDGADNDGDGRIDFDPVTYRNPGDETTPPAGSGDPGCFSPRWATESPQCQDGQDNDGDTLIDFDGGLSALGYVAADPDPNCINPYKNSETVASSRRCGLGTELLLLPPLMWLWRRRRSWTLH